MPVLCTVGHIVSGRRWQTTVGPSKNAEVGEVSNTSDELPKENIVPLCIALG